MAIKNTINRLLSHTGYIVQSTRPEQKLFAIDPAFLQLYENIRSHTLVKMDRCFVLYQIARAQQHLPGAIAELGVYKGGTAKLLAELTKNTDKKLYLFDTFTGMPWHTSDTEYTPNSEKEFTDTTLPIVQQYLTAYPHVEFRPGFFPDTSIGLEEEHFSLVYLDADLYQSTQNGLKFFWDRLTPGGVVIVDDYGSKRWSGVRRAVDEFATEKGTRPIVTTSYQCMLIKAGYEGWH